MFLFKMTAKDYGYLCFMERKKVKYWKTRLADQYLESQLHKLFHLHSYKRKYCFVQLVITDSRPSLFIKMIVFFVIVLIII